MYSFILGIVALVLGYVLYGRLTERIFGIQPDRKTPAITKADGVDYVPLSGWRAYMIQFLNIAGTGPIFGAVMGAQFGPSSYLWIVLGSIFAGGVHDYLCGMLSVRHGGAGVPDIVTEYLGRRARVVMMIFSMTLLLLVGTVFVYTPALLLGDLAPIMPMEKSSVMIWVAIVFAYYVVATLLPVDKLIGRVYPLFAAALIFMAVAMCVCLFVKWPSIPEVWDGVGNLSAQAGIGAQPLFPCLFITIACGAISGFHSTQSPIIARCITNERQGRPIFYGAMITEGIVALVWAAVSSYFFFDGGKEAIGAVSSQAPAVVNATSRAWLGGLGGVLAILGVVLAPITSGDTAFRSARLIIADFVHLEQRSRANRLYIAVPIFAAAALLVWYNIADDNGFNVIWRYFGWANQTLAALVLWTATTYFSKTRKGVQYLLTLIPACFLTSVCVTYICVSKIGFNLPESAIPWLGGVSALLSFVLFFVLRARRRR